MGNTLCQDADLMRRLPNDDRHDRIIIGENIYVAQRYMGFGATGLVLEATNLQNETTVVLKIFDWDSNSSR